MTGIAQLLEMMGEHFPLVAAGCAELVFGALLLGVGMSLCMVFGYMVQGIVIGLLGILALLCLIPLAKGLK